MVYEGTDFASFSLERVQSVYLAEMEDPRLHAVLARILEWDEDRIATPLLADGERGLPGEHRFRDIGYHRMMLGRYVFAGSQFCAGADVLDSCCGLGWGAYILAQYARRVTAFDRDPEAIAFCREAWRAPNLEWMERNALDPNWPRGRLYDVVMGMETIEHFTLDDSLTYLREGARVLRPGGIFLATSGFPESTEEARALESRNPYHLHIFTRREIIEALNHHFRHATVIGNWMVIAVK